VHLRIAPRTAFLHDGPRDRPSAIFNGTTTLHFRGSKANYLLLPSSKKQAAGKKHRK